jgi:nitrogen regulatory protein P-II 1
MRMIVAIIQPTKLSTVREALIGAGIDSFTVCDALGYGRQRGQRETFRGNEYRVDLLRKITLEIVVRDEDLERILELVCAVARTGSEGEIGDGKIFVLPIADVIDISAPVMAHEL